MRRIATLTATLLALVCAPVVGGGVAAAQGAGIEVELLEAGSGELQPVRLALTQGSTSVTRLVTEIELTQRSGGDSQTQSAPPIAVEISTTVAAVQPDGTATVEFAYGNAEVEDDGSLSESQLDQVRAQLESIEGIKGTMVLAPSGAALDTRFDLPPDLDDQTRVLIEQLGEQAGQQSIPYPAEPVGEGARWRATQEFEVQGIDFTQKTTYELVAREGNELTIRVRVRQQGPEQTIDTPQGSADLERFRGRGKGTVTSDLTRVMPLRSRMSIGLDQRLSSGDQTVDLSTRTKVRLTSQS